MKTRKITALILSVLMIVSMLPANVFAAPYAVTASDTAYEQSHAHIGGQDEAMLLAAGVLEVKMKDEYGDSWNGAKLQVYKAGELSFEGNPDPSDIEILNQTGQTILVESLGLADDYYAEVGGEEVSEIADGDTAVIRESVQTHIEINLGARADESNVRYAEICGIVTEIEENGDMLSLEIGEENILVEITEKTAEGVVVKTQYFYVDMTAKTASKLNMDSYMYAYDETSIRTRDFTGIRFKSQIGTSAKFEEDNFVIDEYGFIVATEEALDGEELTFDFSKHVTGVGYSMADGTDIVFDSSSDDVHVFTGVVKNVPVEKYRTNLVCKTYTKLTVGGNQFVVYGEPAVGNIYDTAQTLVSQDGIDATTKNVLTQIILDYEGAVGIPCDDLFPKEEA